MSCAAALAETLEDLDLLTQALHQLAWVHACAGEFAAGRSRAARALYVAKQLGSPIRIYRAMGLSGHLAYQMGDWEEARSYLERAVAMARELGVVIQSFGWLGELNMAEGRWEDAACILEEDRAEAIRSGDYREVVAAECKLAELDLLAGHPDAAYQRLDPFTDAIGRPGVWLLPRLAWAQLALGDSALAAATIERAVAHARATSDRMTLPEALRIQALVTIEQAQWDQAERTLDEGLAVARLNPSPYVEGRLLHAYGQFHAHQDAPILARERLVEALAIFQRLGARKDVEWAGRDLATLG